jgi:hypothetical protein
MLGSQHRLNQGMLSNNLKDLEIPSSDEIVDGQYGSTSAPNIRFRVPLEPKIDFWCHYRLCSVSSSFLNIFVVIDKPRCLSVRSRIIVLPCPKSQIFTDMSSRMKDAPSTKNKGREQYMRAVPLSEFLSKQLVSGSSSTGADFAMICLTVDLDGAKPRRILAS